MKTILRELRSALLSTLVLAVACCGVYPFAVWAIAQAAFPHRANGSLIRTPDGVIWGSELLGQRFTGARYFHSRPSAAGAGYDGGSSGGSNLGPTSKRLRDLIEQRVAEYRAVNGLASTDPVPADAVTASASGLDPHISPRNAAIQVARVARHRGLSEGRVRGLVERHTEPAALGVLGCPRVNVLKLNLALDGFGASSGPVPGVGDDVRGSRSRSGNALGSR